MGKKIVREGTTWRYRSTNLLSFGLVPQWMVLAAAETTRLNWQKTVPWESTWETKNDSKNRHTHTQSLEIHLGKCFIFCSLERLFFFLFFRATCWWGLTLACFFLCLNTEGRFSARNVEKVLFVLLVPRRKVFRLITFDFQIVFLQVLVAKIA